MIIKEILHILEDIFFQSKVQIVLIQKWSEINISKLRLSYINNLAIFFFIFWK